MDAMKEGLTNAIAKEFDNIDVTLYKQEINNGEAIEEVEEIEETEDEKDVFDEDGDIGNITIKQMSSPETLEILIRSLIIEDNYEHIKNFVEKFNLQEKVVPLLCKAPEFTIAEKVLEPFRDLKDNLTKEKNLLLEFELKIKELPQLNSEAFLETTMELASFLKNSDYDKNENFFIDNIITTFEGIKDSKDIEALASLDTSVTLMELLDSVLAESYQPLLIKLKEFEDIMFNMGLIANSLDALNIEKYPELEEPRENALNKYGEILDKQNQIMREINQLKLFG